MTDLTKPTIDTNMKKFINELVCYRRMAEKATTDNERNHWQSKIDNLVWAKNRILELEKKVANLKRRIAMKR